MKFLPLLFANLRRKKIRTALTIGSFAVALFLFGLLGAIRYGFRQGIDVAGADRLVVIGRTSMIQPLPIAYKDRLKRTPGVKDVAFAIWFGGVYQDPKNFFGQFAIVPDDWLVMYPEFKVSEEEWKAFKADRQGVVVGKKLSDRFGWKIGDRVPLQAPSFMGGGSWEFNVRGIYHGTRKNDDETQFWLQHQYLIEKAPAFWKGIVGWYTVRIANPDAAPAVAKLIDEEFSNSANETRTQTESAFAASMVKQMGNIELLLVTGNTMAISVRERTNELAVLKAIGYSDAFVLTIVLAESLLIATIGGAIGLWLASLLVDLDPTSGLLLLYLPPIAFVLGAVIALVTGMLAGLLPAITAMRLNVVSALRRI